MQASVGAITLFVDDPERAKEFYGRVFALEPVFEDESSAAFKFENTLVNIVARTAVTSDALIAPASVAPGGAASSLLTIWVEDADAAAAELTGRGVELLNGPIDRPWGVRTAAFVDPDGHAWEIAQQLG
jgi:lactoylglutathione lyase